jgi:hypothetical protein
MSRSRPKRSPPGTRLQITPSAPVVVVRGPRAPGVFSYTDTQWVAVVGANTNPNADLHQLLVALEAAGQRYQAGHRDRRLVAKLQRALNQAVALARTAQLLPKNLDALQAATAAIKAEISGERAMLIEDVLQAWKRATGNTALAYSRTHGKPTGPLIRHLDAALGPILRADMVGHETLVKAILSARR